MKKILTVLLACMPSILAMESDHNVQHEQTQGYTPLVKIRNAIKHGNLQAVQLFIAQGHDPNSTLYLDIDRCQTLLMYACHKNQPAICSFLINAKANVNAQAERMMTPLLFAAENESNPEIARMLIDRRANVNMQNNEGDTALHFICWKEKTTSETFCRLLIAAQADVNIQNCYGETPLHGASDAGCRLLLDSHANPDIPDKDGETPLMAALLNHDNSDSILQLLIHRMSSLHAQNMSGNTALILAAQKKRMSICYELIQTQLHYNRGILTALAYLKYLVPANFQLLYKKRELLLRPWLEPATLKAMLAARNTMHNCAYYYQNVDWLAPIKEKKTDAQAIDLDAKRKKKLNKTLCYAASLGSPLEVSLVINRGADVNTKIDPFSYVHRTPLMIAAQKGHVEVCKELIASGALVNAKDFDSRTALIFAAYESYACCELLLAHKASLWCKDFGETPLMIAIRSPDKEIWRLMIKTQEDHDRGIIAFLGILRRKNSLAHASLYRERNTLLKTWFHGYNLQTLLNARTDGHLPITDFIKRNDQNEWEYNPSAELKASIEDYKN